jgi:hypothetical protein
MATNLMQPEVNLLVTEPVMLQYDANKNTLTAFKHEPGPKVVPCTSAVFIEAIKQYRKKGYDTQFTIGGHKATDDDIFTLIKELSEYIKTVTEIRPSTRKELVLKYIANYASRW